MKIIQFLIICTSLILISCNGQGFEEQIKKDITTLIPSGICDSIPKGATLSNIVIGDIVDIGLQGMTDVTYDLDYNYNGITKHHSSAMLYIKQGSSYTLASLGGCNFELEF